MPSILRRGFLFLGASAGILTVGIAGRVGYLRFKDNLLPRVDTPELVNVGGWALDVTESQTAD